MTTNSNVGPGIRQNCNIWYPLKAEEGHDK